MCSQVYRCSAAWQRVSQGIDASLEGQLAFERYRRTIKGLGIEELRRDAERLAELALVTQPAVIRWLLAQVLEHEKRQMQPVEDWHLALAAELLADAAPDQEAA
jgi:hypothetical protein